MMLVVEHPNDVGGNNATDTQ